MSNILKHDAEHLSDHAHLCKDLYEQYYLFCVI